MAGRGRQRGMSLLELAVVIVVIGLLMAFAAERILRLTGDIERVNMQRVVGLSNTALAIEFAERITSPGGRDRLAELNGINPMTLMLRQPVQYVGVYAGGAASAPKGRWYWRPLSRQLVYRVEHEQRFEGASGTNRVAFRSRLIYEDVNGDGRFTNGVDHPRGARLVPATDYSWL